MKNSSQFVFVDYKTSASIQSVKIWGNLTFASNAFKKKKKKQRHPAYTKLNGFKWEVSKLVVNFVVKTSLEQLRTQVVSVAERWNQCSVGRRVQIWNLLGGTRASGCGRPCWSRPPASSTWLVRRRRLMVKPPLQLSSHSQQRWPLLPLLPSGGFKVDHQSRKSASVSKWHPACLCALCGAAAAVLTYSLSSRSGSPTAPSCDFYWPSSETVELNWATVFGSVCH